MKHVPIDKIAAEDRLRACDAIQTALVFLLNEAEERDSDSLVSTMQVISAMQVQCEYLQQELDSLREILRLSGEAPSEAPHVCACEAMRKLQEKGLAS
jgi:hypothetical protein